jgi:hypothetical protein
MTTRLKFQWQQIRDEKKRSQYKQVSMLFFVNIHVDCLSVYTSIDSSILIFPSWALTEIHEQFYNSVN